MSDLETDTPIRDLRAEVAGLQKSDKRLSQAVIARESGVSDSALSQWLNGIYPGDNSAIEEKIARWLDAHYARAVEARMLPAAPTWVQTATGEKILSALAYAQIAGDIAVIYGGAGLGKTTAIKHFAVTNPNVWHATMSPATAGVVPALEEIAFALGIRDLATGAARVQRSIVRRLAGTHGLLVVDEAQHLSIAALDQVRSIQDATGVGLALVGNESVYARMTGGNRAAYLDRLYSRIGKRVALTRATQADIDAVVGAWGVTERQCLGTLREIASKPGALRGLTKTLRLASMFAAGADRAVCCDDIRAAWRDLGGES